MKGKRRNHSTQFKVKEALAALKSDKMASALMCIGINDGAGGMFAFDWGDVETRRRNTGIYCLGFPSCPSFLRGEIYILCDAIRV